MFVKICANKSIEDARMTIEAGADFLGILVGQQHSSVDFVDKETAKEIVKYANGKINTVLVTHITNAEKIIYLTKYIGNKYIQLHSDISENEVSKIAEKLPDIKFIRLIHISTNGTICTDYKKIKFVDYYLIDSFNKEKDQVGGTGLMHNWDVDRELIKELNRPTFIAGGLNPSNVVDAIKIARPYGVDVNSGCKKGGVKNGELVKEFVYNAKNFGI